MADPDETCVVCGGSLGLRSMYCEACTDDKQDAEKDEWDDSGEDAEFSSDRYYGDYEVSYDED